MPHGDTQPGKTIPAEQVPADLGHGVRATTTQVLPCDSEEAAAELAAQGPHLAAVRLTADGWQPPAVATAPVPREAVDVFRKVWSRSDLAGDLGERLTCTEVEALAELLTALGAPEAAAVWLEAHADGDDPDDAHYRGDGEPEPVADPA